MTALVQCPRCGCSIPTTDVQDALALQVAQFHLAPILEMCRVELSRLRAVDAVVADLAAQVEARG